MALTSRPIGVATDEGHELIYPTGVGGDGLLGAEVLTAHQLGMSVASLATITNVCNPDQAIVADCDHVIAAAAETAPRVRRLITTFLENGLCRSDTMSPVTASQTLK